MSYLLTLLIVLAMMLAATLLSVRKYFLTSETAGYVFVAINWSLMFIVTVIVVLLIKLIGNLLTGSQ